MSKQPKHVITLVHGTFDSNPDWIKPESPLNYKLQSKFGSEGLAIEPFKWTGDNSHRARIEGGIGLSKHLTTLINKFPDSRHSVIAHSHGGNVAMLAMKDREVEKNVSGLVCLATPFLVIEERPIDFAAFKTFWEIFFLFLILGVLSIGALYVLPVPWLPILMVFVMFRDQVSIKLDWINFDSNKLRWIYRPASKVKKQFSFLASKVKKHFNFLPRIVKKYLEPKEHQYEDFRLPELPNEKLFVIRTTGDEASGALITFQFYAWLMEQVWNFTSRLIKKSTKKQYYQHLGFIWVIGIFVIWLVNRIDWFPAAFDGYGLIFLSMIFPAIIYFSILVLQAVLAGLFVANSVVRFGKTYPLMVIHMRCSTESVPIGENKILLLSNKNLSSDKPKLFGGHTRPYEDEESLDQIVNWIKLSSRS